MEASGTRSTLLVYLLLLLLAVVPFLWIIGPFMLPLAMGALLAVICAPLYARLVRARMRKWAASLLLTVGLVVLVMTPLTWFLVTVIQEAAALVGRFAGDPGPRIDAWMERLANWEPVRRLMSDPEAVRAQVEEGAVALAKAASAATLDLVVRTPEYLLDATLCALAVYFLLIDGERFYEWIGDKLPLPAGLRDHLAHSFRTSASAVVLSSMAAAGAQTVIVMVAFLALGTPFPFLAAFATFIFAWVPLVGIAPVVVAGAVWHWTEGNVWRAIALLAAGGLGGIADNIVRPWVLKGRDEMHPLLSLVAIFGGLAAFGMLGAFLGPVLAAMAVAVLRTWPAVAKHCDIAVAENARLPDVPLPPPEATPVH